jgi:hypothetical protein
LDLTDETPQSFKNRANFRTTSDATGELDGLFVALLFFGADSALARSGIAANTEHPADMAR